jgi:Skp family chaperone for outer membrane proteins
VRVRPSLIAVAGLLLAVTAGCDYFRGKNVAVGRESTVAILDLDSVAKQLGYDVQIVAAMKQQKVSLEQQLGVIKASYEQELGKRKNQVGDKPSQEQTQYLADSVRQANDSLVQQKVKADRLLNLYSAQLIKSFRDRVKTAAREVAGEQGLSVILTKNDAVVFDYNTAVDITDAVVEKMRAEQAAAPVASEPPPRPTIEVPPPSQGPEPHAQPAEPPAQQSEPRS